MTGTDNACKAQLQFPFVAWPIRMIQALPAALKAYETIMFNPQ